MQLSQKQKIFSNFFLHFLSFYSILEVFKKNDSHRWYTFEFTDPEKRGKIVV